MEKENLLLRFKRFSLYFVIKNFARLSEKNIKRILFILGIFSSKKVRGLFRKLRQSFSIENLQFRLYKRLLLQSNKVFSKSFINSFLIQGIVLNQNKRAVLKKKGLHVPSTLLISPSMRCNLDCIGCYANSYTKADDMDILLFDRIITEGEEAGVVFYTILGGEPFIRKDIIDVFNIHKNSFFQVFTNGTLIDKEVIRKIYNTGNVFIIFSVEGFSEMTDKRRGQGTYKKVLDCMDLLKSEKIPFGYSVTVTSENMDEVTSDSFFEMMIDKGAVLAWHFLYMPVGCNYDLSLMPDARQRLLLKERVHSVRREKPLMTIDFWGDAPFVGGCIAGSQFAHINNKGDVEPCIFVHFAKDNIKGKKLVEVLNSDYFRDIRSRQPYSENLYRPCMLIDNPEVSRDIYKLNDIKPTHIGADDFFTKIDKDIDKYAKKVKEVFDKEWERERLYLQDKSIR